MIAIAPSLAEVVTNAGGWLFDQVMAGWDVTVATADTRDERALRILGVRGKPLEEVLAAPVAGPCLEAIALRTDLYVADERVRRLAQAAEANDAEIRLWGDAWPADFEEGTAGVSHDLSFAARAFKAQALRAVAEGAGTGECQEVLRRGSLRRQALAALR